MRFWERYTHDPPVISLEVFPPKDGSSTTVIETVKALSPIQPAFVSVTCSAGGSGSDNTLPIAIELQQQLGVGTVVHVTCGNRSRDDLEEHLREIGSHRHCNIMALRGDPPKGHKDFIPHANGYRYAVELVEHIARINREGSLDGSRCDRFSIGVAGYPEAHPEAPDLTTDLKHLKAKVDAGADFVATQMFFDAQYYIDFVRLARGIGIEVPIVPGVMPVERYPQVMRLLDQMGIGIPDEFRDALEATRDDADTARAVCRDHTIDMCRQLLTAGAPGLHFYTLNKSHATEAVLRALFP